MNIKTETTFVAKKIAEMDPPRFGSSAVVWKNYVYIFGGRTDDNDITNLLCRYCISSSAFEDVEQTNFTEPRKFHTSLVYNDKMYVFGGLGSNYSLCIFDFNTNTWTNDPITSGESPENRESHIAVLIGNKMVIYGGFIDDSLNDCFELDLDTLHWQRLAFNPPLPFRSGHTAVEYNNKIIVHGGLSEDDILVFEIDPILCNWKQIRTTGAAMLDCDYHSSVLYNDKMYIFGEERDEDDSFSDFDEEEEEPVDKHLYVLDLQTFNCTKNKIEGGIPESRYQSAIVSDGILYIFGGTTLIEYLCFKGVWKIALNTQEHQVYTRLSKMLNYKSTSDLIIEIDNEEFFVHKCIVTRTKPLRKMVENVSKVVLPKEFKIILDYLYTGTISENIASCNIDYLSIAKQYEIYPLVDVLLDTLDKQMSNNLDLVIKTLQQGTNHKEVINLCLRKISENRVALESKAKELINVLDKGTMALVLETLCSSKPAQMVVYETPRKSFSIVDHLRYLRRTQLYTDISLTSRDKKAFAAHKTLLAAFDDFFYTMFQNEWKEDGDNTIQLEYNNEVVEYVMSWIYQCPLQLPQKISTLFEIYDYARKTNNRDLMENISDAIIQKAQSRIVFTIYELCKEWQVEGNIPEACEKYMKEMNTKDLVCVFFEQQNQMKYEHAMQIEKLENRIKEQTLQIEKMKKEQEEQNKKLDEIYNLLTRIAQPSLKRKNPDSVEQNENPLKKVKH